MSDLKPCPFCGQTDPRIDMSVPGWIAVECLECGSWAPTEQTWNRRAKTPQPDAATPKDYEALKQLRRLACKAWRHDLTRQQALDALKNIQNAAQDSYTPDAPMTDALAPKPAACPACGREGIDFTRLDRCEACNSGKPQPDRKPAPPAPTSTEG